MEDLKGQWGFRKGDISKKIPLDSALHGIRYRLEESAVVPLVQKTLEEFFFYYKGNSDS